MKQVITAKLKLYTTPEQFQALRATQLAYRDALNYVSRHAFEHGKISNQVRLQKETYAQRVSVLTLDGRVVVGYRLRQACCAHSAWRKHRGGKTLV